jgi:CHAD domain-containing protein
MVTDYVKLKEIKPTLSGYIREAQLMLDPVKVPDEKVVHDVRVLMKKARASIKLLKTQIDEESYNREYSSLREIGRIMQSWRETSVHRKLLRYLKKKYPELFSHLTDNDKINLLLTKPEIKDEPSSEMKGDLEKIIGLLHKSDYRLRFQNMSNLDPILLLKELDVIYNTLSICYLKARNYPKGANVHLFRKKTKDFLYQLFFFRSLNPKVIKELEKRLDTLAQNLGKYNDYSVLIKTLGYKYTSGESNNALNELAVIIKQEQDKYLSRVWPSAFRILRPGQKLANVLGFKMLVI